MKSISFLTMGLLTLSSSMAAAASVNLNDPSAVLSAFYTNPPSLTGSTLTALATALVSVESTWVASPQFTSMVQAIFLAAPKDEQSTLLTATSINYFSLTTATWWTSVPDSAKSYLAAETSALGSVQNSILGTPTSTKNVAAKQTGALAAGVAGVVGLVGVMAAL